MLWTFYGVSHEIREPESAPMTRERRKLPTGTTAPSTVQAPEAPVEAVTSDALTTSDVLRLQRAIGNHATTLLVQPTKNKKKKGAQPPKKVRPQTWVALWGEIREYIGDHTAQGWFVCADALGMTPVWKPEDFGHGSRKDLGGSERANNAYRDLRLAVWEKAKIPEDYPKKGALKRVQKSLQ
jgi:hypothetical protein